MRTHPRRKFDSRYGRALAQKIAKIGENMNIRRFTRYQLGEA